MKNIVIIILMLFSLAAYSQTAPLNVALKFQIASPGSTGTFPTFTVTGNVNDELGRWNATDVQVGDSLYVLNNQDLIPCRIAVINSAVSNALSITVTCAIAGTGSLDAGQAAIIRPTGTNKLPTYISGLNDALQSLILNRQSQIIDNINVDIIKYIGIAGVSPAVSASTRTGEIWKNSVGELYRSNGTIWINIGASSNIDPTGAAEGDGLGYSTVGALFVPKKFIEGSGTNPAIPKYSASNINGIVPSQLYELGGKIGVKDATPSYSIDITGTGTVNSTDGKANRTIGMNGTPLIYLPSQDTFLYSIAFGTGLRQMVPGLTGGGQGYYNTSVGVFALDSITTAYGNTAVGYLALNSAKTAFDNVAIGAKALRFLTGGDDNNATGINSLEKLIVGSNNNAYGGDAGQFCTTCNGNVFFGNEAGRYYGPGVSNVLTNAKNGIFMGHRSRAGFSTSDNEIVIGWEVIGNGSNTVTIGNDTITKTIVGGKLGAGKLASNPDAWLFGRGDVATAIVGTQKMLTLSRPVQSGVNYPQVATWGLGKFTTVNTSGSYDPKTRLTLYLKNAADATESAETPIITYTSTGRVAIGDTIPLAKLSIGSRVGGEPTYRGDLVLNQESVDGTNGGLEFKHDQNAAGYGYRILSIFNGSSNYDLWFQNRTNSATWTGRTIMNASGEWSFGGLAPTARLDLNQGTLRIRDFTTNGNVLIHNATGVVSSATPASIVTAGGGATASGASGQIAYFNGTSTLTSKSAFVFDATNDRMGIGVTPSFRLDIGGTANTSQRKIGINNTQVVYLPDQTLATAFRGTLYYGTGGNALSHVAGEDGRDNSAFGIAALNANTTGYGNHAFGFNSLLSNTTGYYNIGIGVGALAVNLSGHDNFALGTYALSTNSTGNYNIALGFQALLNATGTGNFALGASTLQDLSSGSSNLAIGYNTARGLGTGSNNLIYGNSLGSLPTALANAVIIGSSITGLGTLANNTVLIADGAGNRRITVLSSGFTGINTVAPAQMLHVAGNARVNGSMRSDSMLEVYGTETTALGVRLRNPTATNGRVWDFRSKDNGRLDLTRDNSVNVMSSWRFNDFYQRGSGFFGPVITSIEAPLVVGVDSTASDVRIGVENKGITSGSHAVVQLRTATGFGDPKIIFRDVGAVAGYIGADAQDGMKLKIGYGTDDVGGNTQMTFAQDGTYFNAAKHDVVSTTSGTSFQINAGSSTYSVASGTTTVTLPEIVTGTPGVNQVTVGYTIKIINPTGVSVTVAASGSDLIWSASSVTLLTVTTLKLTANSSNQWSID